MCGQYVIVRIGHISAPSFYAVETNGDLTIEAVLPNMSLVREQSVSLSRHI